MTSLLSSYGLPIVFGFVIIELCISLFLRDNKFDLKESLSNVSIGVLSRFINGLLFSGLAYGAYAWANQYALFEVELNSPLLWLGIVLLVDLAWYFEHRIGHITRLGWSIHSVHHSAEKYNYTVALRLPWLGPVMRIPFLLPLAFIGFPPVMLLTAYSLVFIYQIWIHTEYIGKLGLLEKIFNTPSSHRVHHGSNKLYHDKNFGGILIIWDRMFGTYQAETEKVIYGITEPIQSSNPVKINFHALAALVRDMWKAPSLKFAFLHAVRGPGNGPMLATENLARKQIQ